MICFQSPGKYKYRRRLSFSSAFGLYQCFSGCFLNYLIQEWINTFSPHHIRWEIWVFDNQASSWRPLYFKMEGEVVSGGGGGGDDVLMVNGQQSGCDVLGSD